MWRAHPSISPAGIGTGTKVPYGSSVEVSDTLLVLAIVTVAPWANYYYSTGPLDPRACGGPLFLRRPVLRRSGAGDKDMLTSSQLSRARTFPPIVWSCRMRCGVMLRDVGRLAVRANRFCFATRLVHDAGIGAENVVGLVVAVHLS